MTVGDKIKLNRKKKHFTQSELSKECGISQMSIRRYESGERIPTIAVLQKIASALSVSIDELYDEIIVFPEVKLDVYGSSLVYMKSIIEENNSCLKNDLDKQLLDEINKSMKQGERIKDDLKLEDFYINKSIELSHKFLRAIDQQYIDHDVTDLVYIVNGFCCLTDKAQHKVSEYIDDLLEIDIYKQKSDK